MEHAEPYEQLLLRVVAAHSVPFHRVASHGALQAYQPIPAVMPHAGSAPLVCW